MDDGAVPGASIRLENRDPARYTPFMGDQQAESQPVDAPTGADGDAGASTVLSPAKKAAPSRRKPKQLPPYKVLLNNDDVNDFEHVINAVLKLTTLGLREAVLRTLEAHETGLALLLVTHRERAELYVEQFASLSLTVTIEPDSQ
ncbi:MAG: ATP-dependent Clp protease adaptor ClpS [Phycisphaerae bacterium]